MEEPARYLSGHRLSRGQRIGPVERPAEGEVRCATGGTPPPGRTRGEWGVGVQGRSIGRGAVSAKPCHPGSGLEVAETRSLLKGGGSRLSKPLPRGRRVGTL